MVICAYHIFKSYENIMQKVNLSGPVYLYQRFSSVGQDGNSSLFRQGEAQRDWLKSHPDCVETEIDNSPFIDAGVSAFSGKHLESGSLGRLVAAIESKAIPSGSIILVEHFSRLSRMNISETGRLLDRIWDHDVTIVTARDKAVYSPAMRDDMSTRLRLIIEIDKAHSDSKWRSEKVKSSWTKREVNAVEKSIPPKMRMPFWLDKNGKLNEYESLVKKLFDLYLKGFGQVRIERELKRLFPEAEPLKNVNPTKFIRIILNRKCIGEVYGKKLFEPVVDDATFLSAQEIHSKRLYKSVKADRRWPLHGLITCGHCGSGMSIQQSGKSLPLLRCSNKQRSGGSNCDSAATFPYIIADYFFYHTVEPLLLVMVSNRKKQEKNNLRANEIVADINKKNKASKDLDVLYLEIINEGKNGNFITRKQLELEEEVKSLTSELEQIRHAVAINRSFTISKEALELTRDSDSYNLTLLKLGVKMVLKNRIISFSPDVDDSKTVSIEYIKFDRNSQNYSSSGYNIVNDAIAGYRCRIYDTQDFPQGKSLVVISDGVTADSLLRSKPLSKKEHSFQDVMFDMIDQFTDTDNLDDELNPIEALSKKLVEKIKKE